MKYLFYIVFISLVITPKTSLAAPLQNDSSLVAPSINEKASLAYEDAHNTGTLADFPRLHPLIVHFPIVFLILAFITQMIAFFVFKEELNRVALFLVVLGFMGAYISSNVLHGGDPNLDALGNIARNTFEKHERYAHLTEWFSGIAALAKIFNQFILKKKLWLTIIAVLFMACATYTIVVTGDMGARLVHIDAIGVQGNQIPLHDSD